MNNLALDEDDVETSMYFNQHANFQMEHCDTPTSPSRFQNQLNSKTDSPIPENFSYISSNPKNPSFLTDIDQGQSYLSSFYDLAAQSPNYASGGALHTNKRNNLLNSIYPGYSNPISGSFAFTKKSENFGEVGRQHQQGSGGVMMNPFQDIHNEEFPALPDRNSTSSKAFGQQHHSFLVSSSGAQSLSLEQSTHPASCSSGFNTSSLSSEFKSAVSAPSYGISLGSCSGLSSSALISSPKSSSSEDMQSIKKGIQTWPDGTVTNIPQGMVNDQFGIVSLLSFIRAAENDPDLVQVGLGSDLTNFGLNLNATHPHHTTFSGPFSDVPCAAQDIEFNVPSEYMISSQIKDKLPMPNLLKYCEGLLFYIFYTFNGDILQLLSAHELYSRDWRYNIEERVWITRIPGVPSLEKTSTYERGTYYYFECHSWSKVCSHHDFTSSPMNISNTHTRVLKRNRSFLDQDRERRKKIIPYFTSARNPVMFGV